MTRTLLALGALAAALLTPDLARAQAANMMVAVVDVQKAMEATAHWKAAIQKLEKERVSRQAKLEDQQKKLRERKEKLEARRALSDPKALVEEEETLFRDAQGLSQEFMVNQQALTELEKQATAQMLQRVEALVRELSVEGDFDFVLETGTPGEPNVLYADPKVDLTAKVIALYAKRFKDKPLDLSPPKAAR